MGLYASHPFSISALLNEYASIINGSASGSTINFYICNAFLSFVLEVTFYIRQTPISDKKLKSGKIHAPLPVFFVDQVPILPNFELT